MKEFNPIRTALFVPGNRPDRVDKAVNAGADAVIIDLEDAVPLSQKEKTRLLVKKKIIEHRDKKLIVRINGLDTSFARSDLEEVLSDGLFCIMVPKVESCVHIQELNSLALEIEEKKGFKRGSVSIIPMMESAMAVENAFEIASERTEPERLFTLAFGAADYTLDLGIEITGSGEELLYPRSKIAIACRAGGIDPPLDTPFMLDLKDLKALEADAKRARQLGFQGKLCVHPNQVETCNRLFYPSEDEILFAKKIVQAFNDAEAGGFAAIQVEGKFVDYPVVERARRVLKLAAVVGAQAEKSIWKDGGI